MAKHKKLRAISALCTTLVLLSACGGGGGGVNSTPTPSPSPTPTPAPAPAPAPTPTPTPTAVNFDTAEYRRSDSANFSGAITAWQDGATGQGISVGIIDSGIDRSSPEFTGRISSASAAFGGNASYQDEDGHGTAVAGILAAGRNGSEIMGVAFDASIIALRADTAGTCGDTDGCSFNDSAIAQALDRARTSGARVVNISLGGAGALTSTLQQAVDRATREGVVIVVSAGNERDQATPEYDPNNPSPFAASMAAAGNGLVIITTSVQQNGQISDFSDLAGTSQDVVLAALGERVRSLDLENDPSTYYLYSGTSFAAPQVAGAAALLAQAFPNLSGAQIVDLLLQSADDAGATGTDAVYGRGILNIAAAFAPVGTTSLGDGGTAISLTDNGELSSAMGDGAGSTGTNAVAIDALGRAYSITLQRSLTRRAPRTVLSPLADGTRRSAAFANAAFSGAVNFADSPVRTNRFGEVSGELGRQTLSGHLSLQPTPDISLAMAFRGRGTDLVQALGPSQQSGSFLAAQDPVDSPGFETSPNLAMALRYRLSGAFGLALTSESGVQAARRTRIASQGERDRSYRTVSAGLDWHARPVALTLSASLLDEPDSMLGARLAPFFGVTGSQTVLTDASAAFALPHRWALNLAARRGWTRATQGGSADIRTLGWSAGIERAALLHGQDRFGIRIAQPLRVEAGGVDALLPVAYDYGTQRSEWRMTRVNLSPSGREIDTELSYARPVAGGWVHFNGYWRRQPGHIAWVSDDFGGVVRFSVGY
ncbi:MAG: S8 family peptidase [Sphingobium sp.]